jgi:hypothetical protein
VPLRAILFGTIVFLVQLAGFGGPFRPLREPPQLSEFWWHLPALIAGFAVAMLLWPWRIDRWDDF